MTPRSPGPFAAFVRERRAALGLTIQEMADRFAIPPNYISQLENGRIGVPRKYLARFAEALGISELEAMEIAGLMPPPGERAPTLVPSEQRLVLDWRELDEDDRAVVRSVIEALQARRMKRGDQ